MSTTELDLVIDGPYDFGRNVTASIVWRWGASTFPGQRWCDFPVIVLSWWLKELADLAAGMSERVELDFMDGPYTVEVEASGRMWSLTFIRRGRSSKTTVHQSVIMPDELIGKVVAAARSLVDTCRANNWKSPDLVKIDTYLKTLAPANE